MLSFTNHLFIRRLFYFKKCLLRWWRRGMTSMVYLCLFISQALADSTDYLAPSKEQVVKNFGSDSTLIHYIYFAEVIIALVSFVKVKNPLLLTGVIVLLIIAPILMNVALGS